MPAPFSILFVAMKWWTLSGLTQFDFVKRSGAARNRGLSSSRSHGASHRQKNTGGLQVLATSPLLAGGAGLGMRDVCHNCQSRGQRSDELRRRTNSMFKNANIGSSKITACGTFRTFPVITGTKDLHRRSRNVYHPYTFPKPQCSNMTSYRLQMRIGRNASRCPSPPRQSDALSVHRRFGSQSAADLYGVLLGVDRADEGSFDPRR